MVEETEESESSTAISVLSDPRQAGPSNGSSSRPIHSFFGGSNGSSSTVPVQNDKPKKRRKKGEDTAQGTLSRTGDGWSIARQKAPGEGEGAEDRIQLAESSSQATRKVNGTDRTVKRSRRTGIGDEEAEMNDMCGGRAKAAGGKARRRVDSSYIGGASPEASDDPQPHLDHEPPIRRSPRKRKTIVDYPPTREIINLSSDPTEPMDLQPVQPKIVANLKRQPFSRTVSNTSASSKGAHHDPIDVDEHVGPRRIVFAADQKATHSFFSRRPHQTQSSTLEDKPVNGDKPIHAFFANGPGGGSTPGELKDGWGRGVKIGQEWPAPLPGGYIPTHTGRSTTTSAISIRPHRSIVRTTDNEASDQGFWSRQMAVSSVKVQRKGNNSVIPDSPAYSVFPIISAHPAISVSRSLNNREAWTDLFAPNSASHVLGNEVEAEYLVGWLKALSVGSTKRYVFRRVARTKAMDDWIVDDLTPFEDTPEEEEYDTFYEPPLSLGERPLSYPSLEDRLAGCMLLTGPTGTGKSAAVYAAAKELGWQVFEVNPGMGKRTGAGLMNWIGDVGKNHLVQQRDHDNVLDPTLLMNGATAPNGTGSKRGHKRGQSGEYRQSLILIEEADILFQEEQTFWPTIISLIAGSRRPVILTCNEPSRIPIDSLPLQAILYFHPPPSYLAIPYLEGVAKAQGLPVQSAVDMYHSCVVSEGPALDLPLAPNGNEPLSRFDLRKAITQLQLHRGNDHSPTNTSRTLDEFVKVENASFADAFVASRASHIFETNEIDRHEPEGDDELGVAHLSKPMVANHIPVLLGYDRCSEMSERLAETAGSTKTVELTDQRALFIRSTLGFLDPLVPLSAPLLPRSSLFTETIPMIQCIVRADDILEQAEDLAAAQGQVRVDKKTGRPRRSGGKGDVKYQRWFELEDEAIQAVRDSVWAS